MMDWSPTCFEKDGSFYRDLHLPKTAWSENLIDFFDGWRTLLLRDSKKIIRETLPLPKVLTELVLEFVIVQEFRPQVLMFSCQSNHPATVTFRVCSEQPCEVVRNTLLRFVESVPEIIHRMWKQEWKTLDGSGDLPSPSTLGTPNYRRIHSFSLSKKKKVWEICVDLFEEETEIRRVLFGEEIFVYKHKRDEFGIFWHVLCRKQKPSTFQMDSCQEEMAKLWSFIHVSLQ